MQRLDRARRARSVREVVRLRVCFGVRHYGGLRPIHHKSICLQAIYVRALCGTILVTEHPGIEGNETYVVHRVDAVGAPTKPRSVSWSSGFRNQGSGREVVRLGESLGVWG